MRTSALITSEQRGDRSARFRASEGCRRTRANAWSVRVYLARHGETTWNVSGRYQGRRESALTDLGVRQAAALAGAMDAARIGRVVSSPMLRCTATAQPAAERRALALETDPRLIEIAHGSWEGRLRDEIAANDPQRYRAWRDDPAHVQFEGGENLVQVLARWRAFAATFHPRVPVLVVTHDAIVRVALVDATSADLSGFWKHGVENGAYAVFEVDAAGWTLVTECVAEHLGTLRAPIDGQAL